MARSEAVAMVFSVTELLEPILIELPERDLLLAQRVKKQFQATIVGSKPIQRKLFFEVEGGQDNPDKYPELNPLVKAMYPKSYWDGGTGAKRLFRLALDITHCHEPDDCGDLSVHLPILKPNSD